MNLCPAEFRPAAVQQTENVPASFEMGSPNWVMTRVLNYSVRLGKAGWFRVRSHSDHPEDLTSFPAWNKPFRCVTL